MNTATFKLNNVCGREATIEYDDDNIITSLNVRGGCNGNLKGISALVVGMKLEDVANRLERIVCMSGGRGVTSCPAEIAKGIKNIIQK